MIQIATQQIVTVVKYCTSVNHQTETTQGGPTICLSVPSLLLQLLLYTFLHFDNIFRRVTCQVSLDKVLIEFPE